MSGITNENRNGHIDVIGGLMILQMMLSAHVVDWSHLEGSFLYNVLIRVFPFYLPFFFFKSGYFSHLPKDFSTYRKKLFKKVLLPYVYFSIIGFLVYTLVNLSYGLTTLSQVPKSIGVFFYAIFKTGSHGSNIPIWFLFTFFLVRLSHPLLASVIKKLSWQIIISTIFVIAAFFLKKYSNVIDYPLWINNFFLGMLFYLLGGAYLKYEGWVKQNQTLSLVVIVLAYLLLWLFDFSFFDFKNYTTLNGHFISWILLSITGILFLMLIRIPFIDNCSLLNYIGKNSLVFLVFHWIIYDLLCPFLEITYKIDNNYVLFLLYAIVIMVVTPLFVRFVSHQRFCFLIGR